MFARQQIEMGMLNFYYLPAAKRGRMSGLDFLVDGEHATHKGHAKFNDACVIELNNTLAPGHSIHIKTAFNVKLPERISRMGYQLNKRKRADGQRILVPDYSITQWYPKPAVYDTNGWNVMPYLDQGEFYGEFGRFEVEIDIPSF
jgi:hypothetical protein